MTRKKVVAEDVEIVLDETVVEVEPVTSSRQGDLEAERKDLLDLYKLLKDHQITRISDLENKISKIDQELLKL